VVHLFGHPADMDPVNALAREKGLFVIEDAAEAHGAEYKGKRAGALADVATFSFYGNKIISTGEGGMLVTDDEKLSERIRLLKGQGMDPNRRYWFPILGYNYRMTNVAAAIGMAQMETIEWHMEQRRRIAHEYIRNLKAHDVFFFQVEQPWAKHAYWLPSIVLRETCRYSRDEVMSKMSEARIETRPFFVPMHKLPIYAESPQLGAYPIADELASRGINLPSYAELRNEEVQRICDALVDSVT
ncbi:MAG: DegT/DnrJ/EryC1/StrS family aminotransferase, partial [Gammaproteobacteria bacterium]|nr:DegT/DnrJ/EryC1/StrS family aminotransferase [Gammaproteobacteria bacterium]